MLQEYSTLFLGGPKKATLYVAAVLEPNDSGLDSLEFLRVNAVTGAVTKLFPLTAAANDSCSSPTLSGASAIYAVCYQQSDFIGKVMLQATLMSVTAYTFVQTW